MRDFPLEHDEQKSFDAMVAQLNRCGPRNRVRKAYYDAKVGLKSLGIAIPQELEGIDSVLGWPALAVDKLAARCKLQGYTSPSSSDFGLSDIFAANDMTVGAAQAHLAAMQYSVSFAFVTAGDPSAGEPEVLITVSSALNATGLWNPRTRALDAGLSVLGRDQAGRISAANLYLPYKIVHVEKQPSGKWRAHRVPTKHRVPRVVPIRYRPSLDRPFGRARINRPIMSLTDSAIRTYVRSEVAAEFFSSPQRYVLNATKEAFMKGDGTQQSQWESILGRIWTLSRDPEDPDSPEPQVGQFPSSSQQSHTDQLRSLAMFFSAETSLPATALGVLHDNPGSAEERLAAERELNLLADGAVEVFGVDWRKVGLHALMVRDGLDEPTPEMLSLSTKWADPAMPSRAAVTDAVLKLVSGHIVPARSDVALEMLGLDPLTVERVRADRDLFEADEFDRVTKLLESTNGNPAEIT